MNTPRIDPDAIAKKFEGISTKDLVRYMRFNEEELMDRIEYRNLIDQLVYDRAKIIWGSFKFPKRP